MKKSFIKFIILILLLGTFVFSSLSISKAYFEFKDAEKSYTSTKENVLKALTQQYRLSLDEQFLLNRAINPEKNEKFADFVMTIQRKNGCLTQGYFLPCSNTTVFELLQYKEYLQNEYKIYYAKKYHYESLIGLFYF